MHDDVVGKMNLAHANAPCVPDTYSQTRFKNKVQHKSSTPSFAVKNNIRKKITSIRKEPYTQALNQNARDNEGRADQRLVILWILVICSFIEND